MKNMESKRKLTCKSFGKLGKIKKEKKSLSSKSSKSSKPEKSKIKIVKGKKVYRRIKPKSENIEILEKVKKVYVSQRCAYIKEDGTQCNNYAAGKGTLCLIHGGSDKIPENMYSDKELIATNGAIANCRIKFNPTVHPLRYISLAKDGLSDVEIAAEFEISLGTLKDWTSKFESFEEAYEIGQVMHERWWIEQAKGNLNERSFNTSLFKFMTMNKLGYSDKIEQKSMNMNIHGVLMVPDPVSEDEWEKEFIDA